MKIQCPYCGGPAHCVTGAVLYGNRFDLLDKKFWRCKPCGAHVGCHPGTAIPLGRLANKQLRKAKMAAHAAFDPLWKSREMTRSQAYAWLADALGISPANCHIGMFDVDGCNAVIAAVAERRYIAEMERAYPHLKGETP